MRFASACVTAAVVVIIASLVEAQSNLNVVTREENASNVPSNGVAVDEVIVESSLYIKPKPQANARKVRSIIFNKPHENSFAEHKRVKRLGLIAKTSQPLH